MNFEKLKKIGTVEIKMNNDRWVRFVSSNGNTFDIHPDDFPEAQEMDPELRTIPGPDPNMLLLTAEDYVWLWEMKISA